MTLPQNSLVVIGAGISGLLFTQGFRSLFPDKNALILEKSKGVGGRLATRRKNSMTFDHGAQYLPQELFEFFSTLPHSQNTTHYFLKGGMTQLAKHLSRPLDLLLEHKLTQLNRRSDHWCLHVEDKEPILAKNVVLTCPLPQTLEILERSQITAPAELKNMTYAKALVFLIEGHTNNPFLQLPYRELQHRDVFSLSNQLAKGTSSVACWVAVMTPEFSEKYFGEPDEKILAKGQAILQEVMPDFDLQDLQLKKWRYSKPSQTLSQPFFQPHEGLFLIGDTFGGPHVDGARQSAQALLKHFETLQP